MKIFFGIVFNLLGVYILYYLKRNKVKDSYSSSNIKLNLYGGAIGLIIIGLIMILKELIGLPI